MRNFSPGGHVPVVMRALLIIRELRRRWSGMDLTVKEGLDRLSTLGATTASFSPSGHEIQKIPKPRPESAELPAAAGVKLPTVLPKGGIRAVTRKKLRKSLKA